MSTLNKIFNLMHNHKCDNKKLASALGLNRQVVTDWKAGRSMSYQKYLPQIAEFFGVSVDYLLGKDELPSPQNDKNSIVLRGRDGSVIEGELSDKQIELIKFIIDQQDKE